MTIDLANLSSKELDTLITKAKKRKVALKKRKPAATVRRKINALAKAEGYTVAELFGTGAAPARAAKAPKPAKGPRKSGGKVAPKYRNPDNPAETWTGRGKQPRWMAALTAQGRKVEDFLIK